MNIINGYTPSEAIFNKDIFATNSKVKNTEEKSGVTFSNVLKDSLDKINAKQIQADNAQNAFVRGDDIDIHEVMLAGQEAKLSLQFAVEVRNKLMEAYQEINRMQL